MKILKANVDDDSDEVLREGPSNVIYVSPTSSGAGGSADDPTSWTTALTNLQDDTIVYFLDGVYEINSVIRKNNIILQALRTQWSNQIIILQKVHIPLIDFI